MADVKNITVLGAGAMGATLGLLAAESGFNVKIRDTKDSFLDGGCGRIEGILDGRIRKGRLTEADKKNILSRIRFTLDAKEALNDADYVIEAVPEVMETKHQVFKEAYELAPKHAIFGTNTSSLMIGDIASAIPEPERVIGVHFFNPPSTMRLLEIVYGDRTSEGTAKITDDLARALGRETVYCRKDCPGFITSRLLVISANEAVWAYSRGEGSMISIDAAMKYRVGFPMGLFEIFDVLGGGAIEIQYDVGQYLRSKLGNSYRVPPLVDKLYKAGHTGQKSRKGFYDWSEGTVNEIPFKAAREFDPIRIIAPLVNESAKLLEIGAATKEDLDKAMILGLNYPRGPLRMADSFGLDRVVNELDRLHKVYREARYKRSPWLNKLVKQGKLGRKTGEGFYSYGPGDYEFLTLQLNGETRVAKLTLNRANRANALNFDFFAEIGKALDVFEASKQANCLVVTGAGRNFCAGADVSMFGSGDLMEVSGEVYSLHDLLTRFETIEKPVVAAINGPCVGGGLEIAAACDFRIAKKDAVMGFPEANLGLFPGAGGTQRITRLIGLARAQELVLGGENISADKALEWGLVNAVAEPGAFDALVNETTQKLADRASVAQSIAKRVMYYGAQADQRTAIFLEGSSFAPVILSEEASEGITAFNYRRKPNFRAARDAEKKKHLRTEGV